MCKPWQSRLLVQKHRSKNSSSFGTSASVYFCIQISVHKYIINLLQIFRTFNIKLHIKQQAEEVLIGIYLLWYNVALNFIHSWIKKKILSTLLVMSFARRCHIFAARKDWYWREVCFITRSCRWQDKETEESLEHVDER